MRHLLIGLFATLGAFATASPKLMADATAMQNSEAVFSSSLDSFKFSAPSTVATIKKLPAKGMPFKEALHIESNSRPKDLHGIQLRADSTGVIEKGDLLLISFYARCLKGEGQVDVKLERPTPPWEKAVYSSQYIDKDWKLHSIPVLMKASWILKEPGSFQPAALSLGFNLGFDPQTIELGGISCVKLPAGTKLSDLGLPIFNYEGREKDAPWRIEAAGRIDKYRKSDLEIEVVDASGTPVPNAEIKLEMKRHAFLFGTAVPDNFLADSPDMKRQREEVKKLFTDGTLENNLKWNRWERPENRESALKVVDWFNENGIPLRGHCLIWPSWNYLPKRLKTLESDPAALQKACLEHIHEEIAALQGKIHIWDVLNEPYSSHDLTDLCGSKVIDEWFKAAREADPSAKLFLNDYDILSDYAGGKRLTAHQKRLFEILDMLKANKSPIDGVGCQSHFGNKPVPPGIILAMIDKLAKNVKEIQITEFDTDLQDEELAADFCRDFLTVAFSHPSMTAFQMWGIWDGDHWRDSAPVFRKDWTLKPSGKAMLDLLFKEWWTQLDGKTNSAGRFEARVFKGSYELNVMHNGKSVRRSFTADDEKGIVNVSLE